MEDKKTLSIEEFVELLLATLANNPKIISLEDKENKIATLPSDYKQIIENILCAENRWKEEFSILIDTEDYFDDHFTWEYELAITFKEILKKLNKKVEYDFLRDNLLISFNKNEINIIMEKYQDEYLKNTMEHFANLLTDFIYTRRFQEQFYDYSALAVQKMKKLYEKELEDKNIVNNKDNQNSKKLRLFRKK